MAGIPPLLLLLLQIFLPFIRTYEFHPIQVVETINVNPMADSMQNLESLAVKEEYKKPKWTAKTYKSVVKSEDAAGDVGFFLPYRSLDFLDESGYNGVESPKVVNIQPEVGSNQPKEDNSRKEENQSPQQEYNQPQEEYKPLQEEYQPPQEEYKPPQEEYKQPQEEYKPPQEEYKPPQEEYKPPPEEYKPPKEEYMPPQQEYNPPPGEYMPPKYEFNPPQEKYKPFEDIYKPPQQEYQPIQQEDQPNQPEYQPPQEEYQPHQEEYQPPKEEYGQQQGGNVSPQDESLAQVQDNPMNEAHLNIMSEAQGEEVGLGGTNEHNKEEVTKEVKQENKQEEFQHQEVKQEEEHKQEEVKQEEHKIENVNEKQELENNQGEEHQQVEVNHEDVQKKVVNQDEKEQNEKSVEGTTNKKNEHVDEASVMNRFSEEESKYSQFPTSPEATRRMFEHPAAPAENEISLLGRKMFYRKSNGLEEADSAEGAACRPKVKCNGDSRYRSFDGTCNSIANPLKGAKDTPFIRFLPPAYGDGIFLPRGVHSQPRPDTGYESSLPSPRVITDSIMQQGDENTTESDHNTHMVMQWGQFVDHDILGTSKSQFDCCNPEIRNLSRCFPIFVPSSDSFYGEFGKNCLDFTRSDHHCRRDQNHAEQFNTVTSFLDGSAVYGCHQELALSLRGGLERKEGKLLVNSKLPHFLPSAFDVKMQQSGHDKPTDFMAGDNRVETHSGLTAMQNLFFNEHNRIAGELFKAMQGKIGERELDELVYQETRSLVVATMQQITYSEFLPAVLGDGHMSKHGLNHQECQYKESTDPSIFNCFSTAAFRFGHSLVQSVFRGVNQPWKLGRFYGDSQFAFKDNGHGYVNELEGLSEQPCQKADLHMSDQLSHFLYCNKEVCDKETSPGAGHDLVSTNIQRGRDHGIPGYNKVRQKCGLSPLSSMSSNPAEITQDIWSQLGSVYKDVEEVDLYVGGLAESPVEGGLVGPTFACIIGNQFQSLMDGDRYFYRHTAGPGIRPLSGAMFDQIRKRKLSDVICENTDIKEISNNVFIQPGGSNPKVPCSSHSKLDLASIAKQLLAQL